MAKCVSRTRLEMTNVKSTVWILVDLLRHQRVSGVVAVSSCPAAFLPDESLGLTSALCSWFWCDKIPFLFFIRSKIKLQHYARDCYLAGDVRGHWRWRLRVGVGVLWDEAWVMGGHAAEPVSSRRGHLKETVDRISHQYITQYRGSGSRF